MDKQEKLTYVQALIAEGLGRRRIAKAMETTEWEARQLMADVMAGDTAINPTKHVQEKERITIGRSAPFDVSEKFKPSVTRVKVSREGQAADTPSKINIRPISLKVAVVSDIHYPYEDKNAIELCKNYLDDYDPDWIVFNGDIADCYTVSRYEKNMKGRPDIQEELDYTSEELMKWTMRYRNAQFKFLEGNHEARLKKHISMNVPSFLALRGLSFPELTNLEALGIEWIGAEQDLHIGNLMFTHGNRVRKHAGTTARAHFEDYGCSVLVGHVHRLSVAWKRNKYGNHAMIENGTLCDFDVEYLRFPDWQHGFTTIDFDGDDFTPHQHAVCNYKLIAGGKAYTL